MNYPPGTIGVISSDLARYAWFTQSLMAQELPAGMQFAPIWVTGHGIPAAVNRVIQAMAPESQWLQIWADDHRFDPDTLLRLLAHERPLVAPLCPLRAPPHFQPSMFDRLPSGEYRGLTWADLAGRSGLLPVDATGGPGMVIRRQVLDALGDPWFENKPGSRTVPQEEMYFCEKVRGAGFEVLVDLDTPIEHLTSMSVRPHQEADGTWHLTWWSYGYRGTLLPMVESSLLYAKDAS